MSGFGILDVAIGLAFVYLLLALIVSVVNEWISALFTRRANGLVQGLKNLLDSGVEKDKKVNAGQLLKHPLICSMYQGDRKPSYIDASSFALALVELIRPADSDQPLSLASLRTAIGTLSKPLQQKLLPLIDAAGNDLNRAMSNIERWFDAGMERVSGKYKRWNMLVLACVATVFTIALDADTLAISKTLWMNPIARQVTLEAATAHLRDAKVVQSSPTTSEIGMPDLRDQVNGYVRQLSATELVPGIWSSLSGGVGARTAAWLLKKFFGWLITIAAVSLGAPFWFDTLNRLCNLRSSVKPETPQAVKKDPAAETESAAAPSRTTHAIFAFTDGARERREAGAVPKFAVESEVRVAPGVSLVPTADPRKLILSGTVGTVVSSYAVGTSAGYLVRFPSGGKTREAYAMESQLEAFRSP